MGKSMENAREMEGKKGGLEIGLKEKRKMSVRFIRILAKVSFFYFYFF